MEFMVTILIATETHGITLKRKKIPCYSVAKFLIREIRLFVQFVIMLFYLSVCVIGSVITNFVPTP